MHDIFATVCEFFRTSGPTGLFWNSFIESFFLVPPPDILLGMMTLSGPQKAVYFATLCTLASALGAIVGYFIGYFGGRPIFNFFFRNNHSQFEKVEAFYDKYGSAAVFFAAFTPIPYKVFTIASGVLNMNLAAFSAASIVGRGMRFFIVALGLMFFGEAVKRYLEPTIFVVTILALVVFLFWYHRKVVKKKQ